MNKLVRILVCVAALAFAAQPAFALNDTIGVTAGSGKTANLISFASTHVISEVGICDPTTENQCAGVTSTGYLNIYNGPTNDAATCAAGNSQDSCLRQIDADVKAPTAISTWAAGTLGAMANFGTSPGAVLVPGVNANVFGGTSNASSGVATGAVSIPSVSYNYGYNGTTWDQLQVDANKSLKVAPALATSGGYTTFFVQPAASDNHTNIKNGAGQVYWILAENNSATINYLRFYNAATGFNGCNSATGLITQVQIPASTSVGGISIPLPFGIPFSTGISICVTSGYATTDTTNATATAISLTIGYN